MQQNMMADILSSHKPFYQLFKFLCFKCYVFGDLMAKTNCLFQDAFRNADGHYSVKLTEASANEVSSSRT